MFEKMEADIFRVLGIEAKVTVSLDILEDLEDTLDSLNVRYSTEELSTKAVVSLS